MTSTASDPAAPLVEDVVLRDGSTLRLRVPTAADEATLDRLLPGALARQPLPPVPRRDVDRSRDRRRGARDRLARRAPRCSASSPTPAGSSRPVALATYVRLHDPRRAEVAFAVADDLHGRGVGTRLLERLAAHASESGIEEFVAEVLPQNHAMLGVFDDAGFETARTLQGGVVEVTLRLASHGSTVAERRDVRDHVAVAASLRPFFEPRSVAVIGASARRGTIGGELFRNMLDADFAGAVYPVNRGGEPVGGVAGYATCAELPTTVDLAVICVPGASCSTPPARRSRPACGRSASSPPGSPRPARTERRVRTSCSRSCARTERGSSARTASASPRARSRLNATFARRALPAGRVAFSSQSGALGLALLEEADGRGLGLSSFLSIGNKADVSSNDLLEYWEEDEATESMLLYLESFGNPRKFARVAGRVARSKPILAMRSGTSRAGARAASSHTAALASSDAAVDALFWQAGVLRLRTLEELLDAAVLFSTQPLPRGDRVAVLTNAGGLGHPLRRRLRGRRSDAAAARGRDGAGAAAGHPCRGERLQPGRHPRLRDGGDVRGDVAPADPRSRHRRGDLPLRAAGRRNGRRRSRDDCARLRERREAGAPRRDERRRHSGGRLRVSRVRCPRARARRTPRRVAPPSRPASHRASIASTAPLQPH